MRIYKLYREYIQNDMKRESKNATQAVKRVKLENQIQISDYLQLRSENQQLQQSIKRYQHLIKNFDDEYDQV